MSGIYNQGPAREQQDTTLRDLIAVLFKRKWLILGFFLLVTAIVGGRTLMQEDAYTADARVLLMRQGARTSVLERNPRVLPWVEVVETELEVIKTEAVMQRALEKLARPTDDFPDGIETNVFALSRAIDVGVLNESNVLYVQGTAEGPRKAVAITNAVAEAYVEHHRELFKLPDVQARFLAKSDSVFAELELARTERHAIMNEFGLTNFEDEEMQLIRQRQQIGNELITLEREIARLEVEVEDVSNVLAGDDIQLPIDMNTGSVQGNALINTIRELAELDARIEQMSGKYTAAHPELQELRRDREHLYGSLQADVKAVLAFKTHELRAARSEAASLRSSLDGITERLGKIPGAVRRLSSLNTRINTLEDQYEKFGEYIADSQANEQSFQDYGATIISQALRAELKAKGDVVRLALAPLLALMAGIFVAFYLENMDHSLGTREDVERHLDIPVLASFPESELEEAEIADAEDTSRARVPFRRTRTGEA